MNSKIKIYSICILLIVAGLYITSFGIYAITIMHFFINGIILTSLGLAVLMFGIVALIEND